MMSSHFSPEVIKLNSDYFISNRSPSKSIRREVIAYPRFTGCL